MSMRCTRIGVIVLFVLVQLTFAFPPDQLEEARRLMRDNKHAEAIGKIEAYVNANRFDGRGWSLLGVAFHSDKQFERAIEAGHRAIEVGFNVPNQMYNIACEYAMLGKTEEAITWLDKALKAGFTDQETLERDNEMDSLRGDARFIAMTGLNPPAEESPANRWAYDLDFLTRRMEQMHWDLYAKVSKDAFASEVAKLKADAPDLPFERVKARLSKIVASVGDGHTTLSAFAEGESKIDRIPLHMYQFTDGLFIIGVAEAQRELCGARVMKIGALSADEALKRVRAYISVDNDMGYLDTGPAKLNHLAVLQEIGAVADDKSEVEYELKLRDGSTTTVKLAPISIRRSELGTRGLRRPGFVYANDASSAPQPLYRTNADKSLWRQVLDEQRAMYFGFNGVADNDDQSFEEFVAAMFKEIDERKLDHLIIDMRHNGGGNTGLVLPLIHGLIKNERINQPGKLFVIIGRRTFSAAQNTVNLLELHTPATFVGEPTGSRPNFVGESTYIVLPYSKLKIYCSSRYWQHVVSTDTRHWVQPQIAAELSSSDFIENRDPCLEAVLKRIAGKD